MSRSVLAGMRNWGERGSVAEKGESNMHILYNTLKKNKKCIQKEKKSAHQKFLLH